MAAKALPPMDVPEFVRQAQQGLKALANPERAPAMAAYMKTTMPFYGVAQTERDALLATLLKTFKPGSQAEYRKAVLALWALPHREEKYLAIRCARRWKKFITLEALPLYQQLIKQGAWWDLVDDVAGALVGPVLLKHPKEAGPVVDGWLHGPDLWLRRTAIICQIKAKEGTDQERLFTACRTCAHEKDFFIRKAIGWALRCYAATNPSAVLAFLEEMDDQLSPLSRKEAGKHL